VFVKHHCKSTEIIYSVLVVYYEMVKIIIPGNGDAGN
jgi:hypothetical protein